MIVHDMIRVGSDCEFALERGGELVSALDVLDTKVLTVGKAGRVFADNLNVELAINPVASKRTWDQYFNQLLDAATLDGKYNLVAQPEVEYPEQCLRHKQAGVAGCNPDFTLYNQYRAANEAPDLSKAGGRRTLGGHIHFGVTDPRTSTPLMLDNLHMAIADLYLALPMLFHEPPNTRRQMYGGAGCYRPKEYGFEYRTLSSIWVTDQALRDAVWLQVNRLIVSWAWYTARYSGYRSYGVFRKLSEGLVARQKEGRPEYQPLPYSRITDMASWWDVPAAIDDHDLDLAQACIDRYYAATGERLSI